ncbi:hypothetical protein OAF34_00025 [Pirellulaceae bacterium]|jgi:hypothetical protein|nr:hypothetical protein [Pirellulaceae bacterium]
MRIRGKKSSGVSSFIFKVGSLCCLLFVLNSTLVLTAYVLAKNLMPGLLSDPRVIQAVMFLGPVLLIFFEFWLYDRRKDRQAARRRAEESAS